MQRKKPITQQVSIAAPRRRGRPPKARNSDVQSVREGQALAVQVGGSHYKELPIQPVEYIHRNKIGYMEGNVIKYVTRWRDKGGIADLEKAKHYIDLLIGLEAQSGTTNREVM